MLRTVSATENFSTADLRKMMVADLIALRDGKMDRAEARARAHLAKVAIETVKVEIEAHKLQLSSLEPVPLLNAA